MDPAPPPKKPKRGPLAWILIGCGALILVGSLGFGGCVWMIFKMTKAPADATHAFFDKITAGDLTGAYGAADADFQSRVPRAQFDALFSGLKFSDVTINNRNVTNQTATMVGTASVSGGSTYAVTVHLTQVGDAWKIQDVTGPLADFLNARTAR